VRPQKSGIEWRVNLTQLKRKDGSAISGIEPTDLTRGEIDGRRQAVEAFNFLRTVPGFEKSYIVDLPPQLGIRETRRVIGGYQFSGEDVLTCASFPDSIGVNGWPMEIHAAAEVIFKFPPIPESRGFNELPYRMLVPKKIDNLLVAGRCASMTHEGNRPRASPAHALRWGRRRARPPLSRFPPICACARSRSRACRMR
jgi:FAD dependent oxidoreductase